MRRARPLPGHWYHGKTDAELRYIVKDAGEAAIAMRGFDAKSEAKYLDQVNDAATVLHFRGIGGRPTGRVLDVDMGRLERMQPVS